MKLKYKLAILGFIAFVLSPIVAYAINVTVPAASGTGFGLTSTTTGAYIVIPSSGVSGNCIQWGIHNSLTDAGFPCSTGSGGGFPFTTGTNWGTTTSATTTAIQAPSFFASSTLASQFPEASTTNISASSFVYTPNIRSPSTLVVNANGGVLTLQSTSADDFFIGSGEFQLTATDFSPITGTVGTIGSVGAWNKITVTNASLTNATTTSLYIKGITPAAGALLAVDPNGQVISTTTPISGSSASSTLLIDNNTFSGTNVFSTNFLTLKAGFISQASSTVTGLLTLATTTATAINGTIYVASSSAVTTAGLTTVIQNAINTCSALNAIGLCGKVHFGPGIYSITPNTIIGASNVNLEGEGEGTKFVSPPTTTSTDFFNLTNVNNVKISDMFLSGINTSPSGTVPTNNTWGFFVQNDKNLTFENIRFENFYEDIDGNTVQDSAFLHIYDLSGDGIFNSRDLTNIDTMASSTFVGVICYVSDTCIRLEGGAEDITISGSQFYGASIEIGNGEGARASQNINIVGNSWVGTPGYPIVLENFNSTSVVPVGSGYFAGIRGVNITGNTFNFGTSTSQNTQAVLGENSGFSNTTAIADVNIEDNTLVSDAFPGIHSKAAGIEGVDGGVALRWNIEGNNIASTTGDGIKLISPIDSKVSDNTIWNFGTNQNTLPDEACIYIGGVSTATSSNTEIYQNHCTGPNASGVTATGMYIDNPLYITSMQMYQNQYYNVTTPITYQSSAPTFTPDYFFGNVGFGTSTPDSGISADTFSGLAVLHVGDTITNQSITKLLVDNRWNAAGGFGLVVERNPTTPQLVVDGTGNVGVGTSTPNANLDVAGSATVGANYDFAGPANGLMVQGNTRIGTTTTTGNLFVADGTGQFDQIQIQGTNSTNDLEFNKDSNIGAHTDGSDLFIGSSNAGIFFRPQGQNSSTNQSSFDSSGDLTVAGTLNAGTSTIKNLIVQNTSTSTFSGGVSMTALNVTGSGTSTHANGINLATGCFSIAGVCVGGSGGGGTVTSVIATPPLFSSGGTIPNITWAGLATTSNLASSNLLVSNGGAGVYSVATSSLSVTGPITFSGTLGAQVGGSGGSFGCATCFTGTATSLWPWTALTNFGTSTDATTTALTAPVFFASSTLASQFPYASSTSFTASGQSFFSTTADLATIPEVTLGTGNSNTSFDFSLVGGRGMIGFDNTLAQMVFNAGGSKALGFYVNGTNNSFLSGTEAMFISGANGHGTSGDVGFGDLAPNATISDLGNAQIGFTTGQTAPANGLIVSGNIGIGTTTPGTLLALGVSGNASGINFSLATSTFSNAGGINLTTGCFSINNVCVGGSTGTSLGYTAWGGSIATTFGTTTIASTTPLWAQGGIFASSTSATPTLAVTQSGAGAAAIFTGGNVGIATTSPYTLLDIQSNKTGDDTPAFVIDGSATANGNADLALVRATGGTGEANIDFNNGGTNVWQLGIQNTGDFELWDGLNNPIFTIQRNTNNAAFGTTTPAANDLLTLSTSTEPQLTFGDNTVNNQFDFRSVGGKFYIATSAPFANNGATSTVPFFILNGTVGSLTLPENATTTAADGINLTAGCVTYNGGACIGGSGTVTSVTGTTNQITSSGSTAITLSLPNLVIFPGNIEAFASSTIGGSTQTTGLTVLGGATTTNSVQIGNLLASAAPTYPILNVGTSSDDAGDQPVDVGSFIGDNGQDAQLHLQNLASGKGAYFKDFGNSNFVSFEIAGTGSDWKMGEFGSASWNVFDGTNNKTPFSIGQNAPTNSLVVQATGIVSTVNKVGVGTTTPYGMLSISDNTAFPQPFGFVVASSTATATTTLFSITNVGHEISSSTNPVLSACGTAPTMVGDDEHGTVTEGSAASSGCVVTFQVPYSVAPACVVSTQTGSISVAFNYTVSATAITVTDSALSSDKWNYICKGFTGT